MKTKRTQLSQWKVMRNGQIAMKDQKIFIFLVTLTLCLQKVLSMPISVPVDNNYSYNNPAYGSQQAYYDDVSMRQPNSFYNRLPPYSTQAQNDEVGGEEDDYDYNEQLTDKPASTSGGNQQSSNYENLLTNNFLLTENRVKHKKKRRVKRPCIPIQSFGSQLFSNRLRRDLNSDAESGKTLGLLLGGGGGYNNYYNQPYYQPQGGYQDNVKPQYDNQQQNYGQPQYQPYGGYPCVPVNLGHKPGGGLFGNNGGGGLFGGGSSSGGPLGFFGQGGLLDFNSPGPLSPAGIYQGAGSYPQTVIINRPPLFGNAPNFGGGGNRPQYASQSSQSGYPQSGSGFPQDNFSGNGNQGGGFWGSVVNKLQEFVRKIKSTMQCMRFSL